MKSFMLIAVLFFTSATVASAVEPSLSVGGMSVKLGMPQSEVLTQMQKYYQVGELGDGEWAIQDRQTNKVEGMIKFKDGKVYLISRVWGHFSGQALRDFTQTLFSAVANLNEEGQNLAFVQTTTDRSPQVILDTITLRFPTKELILTLGRSGNVVDASIEEILVGTK